MHEFLPGRLAPNTRVGTGGSRSCSPCRSVHTRQRALCADVWPPSPGAQSYTDGSRGLGAGSAVCRQDGKHGAAAQKGFAFPHPLHPPFPLCLTAGVNFTLSCHLSDKIISSWFPRDLSSESLSAELPPAASHEESAAAAAAAVPKASEKPGCSAVPGSRPLVCVPVPAHTSGAQGTRG